jgi:hypothetical protein
MSDEPCLVSSIIEIVNFRLFRTYKKVVYFRRAQKAPEENEKGCLILEMPILK